MNHFKILSTGSALPQRQVASEVMDTHFSKPSGWTQQKLGIQYRYHASGEDALSLAQQAIEQTLQRAGISAAEVGCIIGASGTLHQQIPYNSALYQSLIPGLQDQCECYDVNMTCLSFVKALELAQLSIQKHQYVLIVSAEIASVGLNWREIESTAIFGDGAAAVLLQQVPQAAPTYAHFQTLSSGKDLCQIPGGGSGRHPSLYPQDVQEDSQFQMSGRPLFQLVRKHIKTFVQNLEAHSGLDLLDHDLIIPHQASLNSMNGMKKYLKIPDHQFYNIFAEYGNQIAASIPFALDQAITSGRLQRGNRTLLIGTSAGVSLGAYSFEY